MCRPSWSYVSRLCKRAPQDILSAAVSDEEGDPSVLTPHLHQSAGVGSTFTAQPTERSRLPRRQERFARRVERPTFRSFGAFQP